MVYDPQAGARTADVARKAADPILSVNYGGLPTPRGVTPFQVSDQLHWANVQQTLSRYNCWNAMLVCAHLANGIRSQAVEFAYQAQRSDLGIITSDNYHLVFDDQTRQIVSYQQLVQYAPVGSFIGFVRGQILMHAMIYLGNGWGAGTANGCLFSRARSGWEMINLDEFFDSRNQLSRGVKMIVRPVSWQVIETGR
jgi:hypothetical protein